MQPMNFQTEIEILIRARYPILYVITSEEMRVQQILVEIAARRQKKVFEWTYSSGHRARGRVHPVPERPQPGHQRTAGGAGPGD